MKATHSSPLVALFRSPRRQKGCFQADVFAYLKWLWWSGVKCGVRRFPTPFAGSANLGASIRVGFRLPKKACSGRQSIPVVDIFGNLPPLNALNGVRKKWHAKYWGQRV